MVELPFRNVVVYDNHPPQALDNYRLCLSRQVVPDHKSLVAMHYICYLSNTTVEERYRQHYYVLPSYDSKLSPRLQDTACMHSITTITCFTTNMLS